MGGPKPGEIQVGLPKAHTPAEIWPQQGSQGGEGYCLPLAVGQERGCCVLEMVFKALKEITRVPPPS